MIVVVVDVHSWGVSDSKAVELRLKSKFGVTDALQVRVELELLEHVAAHGHVARDALRGTARAQLCESETLTTLNEASNCPFRGLRA